MSMLRHRPKLPLLIAQTVVVLIALWVWWPAFVTEYGLADDYSFVYRWSQADFDIWQSDVVKMGRPLAALFQRGLFLVFDHVSDLAKIRMISAFALSVFGLLLLRGLHAAGWRLMTSMLTTILVLMTPPFIVFLGWAVMCNATIGAVCALWGSRLYLSHFIWNPTSSSASRWAALGGAAGTLLVAACFYQPAACVFLLLPLATVLAKPEMTVERGRALAGSVGLFLGTLAFYFIGFSLAKQFVLTSDLAMERSTLVEHVGSKVSYLMSGPVVDILGSWWTLGTGPAAHSIWMLGLLITIVAVVCAVLRFPSAGSKIFGASMIAALVGLTFLPVASVESDYTPFRTLGGSYAAWLVLLVGGLAPLFASVAGRRMGIALLALFTVYTSWQARVGLHQGIVAPQEREWAVFQNLLDEAVSGKTHSIVYRMPYALNGSGDIRPYHEFSYPSSISQWGLKGMFHLYMKAAHPGIADENLMIFPLYPWESIPDCGVPLVDGYRALTGDAGTPPPPQHWYAERIRELEIPPFGRVTYHGRNWIYDERFGPAWVYALPPLDMSTTPPTAPFAPADGINFYLIGEGRVFWTKVGVYPSIIDLKINRWYYLAEGTSGRAVLVPFSEN